MAHTDGLVLRVEVPEGDGGAPECGALRLLASLVPLNGGSGSCRGRCVFDFGHFRSHSEVRVFEARPRAPCGVSPTELHEVAPVGREGFVILLSVSDSPGPQLGEGAKAKPLVLFGHRLAAVHYGSSEDGSQARWASAGLYRPGVVHGSAFQHVHVTVRGRGDAFERGIRFVEQLAPGDRFDHWSLRQTGVAETAPQAGPERLDTLGALVVVAIIAAVAALAWSLRRRRASRPG